MRVWVLQELRDKFLAACWVHDVPALQVIRTFTRDYLETRMLAQSNSKHPGAGKIEACQERSRWLALPRVRRI